MKIRIGILCAILAGSLVWGQVAVAPEYGIEEDAYLITSIENLYWLSQLPGYWRYNYVQTVDIDASATLEWGSSSSMGFPPIGNSSTMFTGTYDGQGYTISNLYIEYGSGQSNIGLFGYTSGAQIRNVGLVNVNIYGSSYVGGLVGANGYSSIIEKCFVTGVVTTGGSNAGGMVGYNHNSSTISQCYTDVTVKSSQSYGDYIGGVAARNTSSTITDCYCFGEVNGSNTYIGGLVGLNLGQVINSYSTAKRDQNSGGLIGSCSGTPNGTVTNSFWDIQMSGTTYSNGGTGKTSAQMKYYNTFFTGTVLWDHPDTWNINYKKNSAYPYLSWQTFPSEPLVITGTLSGVTSSSATLAYELRHFGDSDVSQHGICWSSLSNPTILNSKTNEGAPDSAGFFNSNISGLTQNQRYYVRPYATNLQGTTYGEQITFVTNPVSVMPTGSGTEGSPYLIASLENLYWIALESSRWDDYYEQTSNINASGTATWFEGSGWTPIGNTTTKFTGSYDGKEFSINGLTNSENMGLFGAVINADIKNINLTNINMTGAGLIGYLQGNTTVDNCHVNGTVQGNGSAGLLICETYWDAGCTITNCSSEGSVSAGSSSGYVGGLIGYAGNCTIEDCYNMANVSADGSYNTGGLVGRAGSSTFNRCYNTGTVSRTGYYGSSGGLIGSTEERSYINNSYNSGQISGNGYQVGGLVGYHSSSSEITNAYNTGNVNGGDNYVGGLVGYMEGNAYIYYSYNSGRVLGTGSNTGGILGGSSEYINTTYNVLYCYWDTQSSRQATSDGGWGKTSNQMTQQNTFTGFNFTTTWGISAGQTYPYLKWQIADMYLDEIIPARTMQAESGTYVGIIDLNGDESPDVTIAFTPQEGTGEIDLNYKYSTDSNILSVQLFTNPENLGAYFKFEFEFDNILTTGQSYELDLPAIPGTIWYRQPGGEWQVVPSYSGGFGKTAAPGSVSYTIDATQLTYDESGSGVIEFASDNGGDMALPIRLRDFSAVCRNGTVLLSWKTASETENAAFRIYRDDEMIAEIEGAGTSTEPHSYACTDQYVVPGRTYTYQLADVSLDGEETRHNEVEVKVEGEYVDRDYSIGAAYPNPFNPTTLVPLNLAKDAAVRAVLYDIRGYAVRELLNADLSAGSHALRIDGANLSTGIYFVRININEDLHVQKIALMK